MKRKTVGWILVGVLALPVTYVAYIALGYGYRLVSPEARRKGRITKSIDNLRTLLLYDAVTYAALDDPAFDPSALPSYAGRRNDEKEHITSAAEQQSNAPILADLSFPGGLVLGYCGGAARWVSAEELGLPSDEPIVVGDASPIEMLKHLSDR